MQLLRSPIGAVALILLVSLGATILLSTAVVNLNASSVQRLVLTMSGSGIVTTLVAFYLYRFGVFGWLKSIFWTVSVIVLVTVGLIMINVWTLTQMMFISSAYLSITSSVMIFAGVAALVFGFFTTRSMTDRLETLMRGAEKLAKGDLGTRVAVVGNDEIAKLTGSFNAMASDLQQVDEEKHKLEQTRRNLVAWVSHDLRTPLAAMRVMLEAVSDGIVTDESSVNRYIANSLNEISNLDQLIDDLFELAKLDVKEFRLDYEPIALSELLSDVVASLSPKADLKHITMNYKFASDADRVSCAPEKIYRVLNNLIENAIKYTPPNEQIIVATSPTPTGVQVSVTNTGVTIPADQLPKLFDTFYRGEASRAQGDDGERGTGLGLAIARGFVLAHGGQIWATSDHNSTTFSFTLPHRREMRDTGVRKVLSTQ